MSSMKGFSLCGRVLTSHSWKCSWSFTATVGSLVALVLVVHMFFTPLFPSSLDYFGARSGRDICSPFNVSAGVDSEHFDGNLQLSIDFDKRFPTDSHGAVTYRGAPWKAEIGRWFSGCDAVSTSVDVAEVCIYAWNAKECIREETLLVSKF